VNDLPIQPHAARYATGGDVPMPINETLETLLGHRSVRAYLPDALPDGTLETLITAASSAATSSNMQLWSVVSVTDPAVRAKMVTWAGNQAHIAVAPLFLVWLADLSRTRRIGEADGREMAALPYTETLITAVIDAALAAQNAVVAAESLGLGTVYIGALRNRPEDVASALGLPPGVVAVFGLCVGHPDPAVATGIKPRLAQSVVLHHDRYDTAHEAAGIAAYDAALKTFQTGQSLTPAGWLRAVASRLGAVAGLSGRDRLREALGILGFPMR
jgi:nitroreductase